MHKILTQFCNFIFGKHKTNSLPRIWILAADMTIVLFAYLVAVLMYYFKDLTHIIVNWKFVWIYPLPYLVAFLISRTYDGMLRYSGFNDIRKILSSCTWTLVFYLVSKYILIKLHAPFVGNLYPPFIVIIYHYLITMVLMIIMRLTIRRLYNEIYKYSGKKKNTIIYGAGDGGTMLLRTLSQDTASNYTIKAFIDDDQRRVGNQINTVKIFSPSVALTEDFIKKNGIEVMILAIPSLDEDRRKQIIEQGLSLNLSVKSIPNFNQWVD